MKLVKIVASSAAVMFGLVILTLSVLAASNPVRVLPFEGGVVVEKAVARPKVDYYLPYPGILPDSPMYRLKALRDRVVLMLTWDGQAKAKRQLLYADKRINAAIALVEGGTADL